jgi:predicted Zn-dependent protease
MAALGEVAPRRETIALVWLGADPPPGDRELVARALRKTFGFQVQDHGVRPLPEGSYLPWSGQWDPGAILDGLVDGMPLEAVRVLGVLQEDLGGGKADWSLGFGQPEGKAAVVSMYRLAASLKEEVEAGGDPEARAAVYRLRLYKLVCHELGHTFREFGNIHCPERQCLMNTLEFGLADLDRVPPRYCPRCAEEISTAIRGQVNTPVTYYHLGLYFEARGLWARAVEAYRRSVTLDPECARAWNNLGAVLLRGGETWKAERALRASVRASPEYALAHLNLGRVRAKRGCALGALLSFRKALRLDGTLTVAWRDGGRVLREGLGDPEEARVWFSRFLRAGGIDEKVRAWVETHGGLVPE